MARKKKPEEVDEGAPGWIVSYGDMMSLLLTFFILIVSFSTMQEAKFEQALASVKRSMGVMPKNTSFSVFTQNKKAEMSETQTQETVEDLMEIRTALAQIELTSAVNVTLTDKGAHFIIADPLLFESGSARLRAARIPVLDIISGMLRKHAKAEVTIEGHTDNVPIHTAQFASNWELSAARALAIVRYFTTLHNLEPARFGATGYGEYRPLTSNASPQGRSRNRRVEIYVSTIPKLNETIPAE